MRVEKNKTNIYLRKAELEILQQFANIITEEEFDDYDYYAMLLDLLNEKFDLLPFNIKLTD